VCGFRGQRCKVYWFYIDESGSSDPAVRGIRADGSEFEKDHIYVLLAASLFERRWHGFERAITRAKLSLLHDVHKATGQKLELTDAELHSNVLRQPRARSKHPFFNFLSPEQLLSLTDLFYRQLEVNHMSLFAVVIDKRRLAQYFDAEKLKRKAYELLLERIQNFLAEFHPKHLGAIVADDVSVQSNRSLALKHSFFQRERTTANLELRNIVELPFFVRSELSNGIQLADLCAYNVYQAFRYARTDCNYLARILPCFYISRRTSDSKLDGLKVFPDDSELVPLAGKLGQMTALEIGAKKDVRRGRIRRPIEPASGTGQRFVGH
jgi:hypothetical protein